MEDDQELTEHQDAATPEPTETDAMNGEAAGVDQTEETLEAVKSRLEEESARAEEYFKRLQRLQADFDNYRRRTTQEAAQIRQNSRLEVFREMLPVLDNLQRALQAPDSGESLRQGLVMIERQFLDILKQSGIEPIEAVGHPFDPNVHEAVQQVDSKDHADNEIVGELQKGYRMGERVLRVSMVIVARHVEEVNEDGESHRD